METNWPPSSISRSHPEGTTLLIDTYDTEQAAHAVVALARRLEADGITVRAVRIDSGTRGECPVDARHGQALR